VRRVLAWVLLGWGSVCLQPCETAAGSCGHGRSLASPGDPILGFSRGPVVWEGVVSRGTAHACCRCILTVLAAEGVMVASDEPNLRKHMELESVPNLQVMKLMESLCSRGFVRKTYTWNHHYWFLTNEGITYLREYLNLPEMIVPNTQKKQQSRPSSRPLGGDGERSSFRSGPPGGDRPGGFGRGRMGGEREGYRSGPKEPSSYGGDRPSFGRGREGGAPPGGDRPRFGGRGGAPPTAP